MAATPCPLVAVALDDPTLLLLLRVVGKVAAAVRHDGHGGRSEGDDEGRRRCR